MLSTLKALDFKKPDISNYSKIAEFLAPFSNDAFSCEITPMTLLIWKNYYHQKVAFFEDMMFVSLGEEELIFLLPFAANMERAVNILKEYTKALNIPLVFLEAEGKRLDDFNKIFCEEE